MWSDLSSEEIELSEAAGERLGFRVLLYQDGNWICQPRKVELNNGYGSTPEEAEADCKSKNST